MFTKEYIIGLVFVIILIAILFQYKEQCDKC